MRAIRFLALIACLPASHALAAGPAVIGAGVLKELTAGSTVVMPYLIAPVVVGDKLVSYAYVSSTIIAASSSAAVDIRDKTPFIQDAYVRDVNARPIGEANDPATVDAPALAARMLADARRVVGADKAIGVKFMQIQMRPLSP